MNIFNITHIIIFSLTLINIINKSFTCSSKSTSNSSQLSARSGTRPVVNANRSVANTIDKVRFSASKRGVRGRSGVDGRTSPSFLFDESIFFCQIITFINFTQKINKLSLLLIFTQN